jgi:oligopeptide/dipeptide ABC transporter ATP-binding protein
MSRAALQVRELSVGFGNDQVVVDRVSFSIQPGEAVALVGESGCGKTMTALAILGLLPPGAQARIRSIELKGNDISGLDASARRALLGSEIAMVFQQPATALDPVFTLGQQIGAVHRRHEKTGRARTRRAVLEALADVGFRDPEAIADAYPHQLSGGMRQLGMIAMATVCKPSVIIADEPTTALDATARAMILQQLDRLRAQHGTAVMLVSHDLGVVKRSCANTIVMYCGRVVEKSSTDALFAGPRHPYSAGLMACIPSLGRRTKAAIRPIPGQVPALTDLPDGCHFAPRCARCEARCRETAPPLGLNEERAAACFNPLP